MAYEERMEQLEELRRQFPDWFFSWQTAAPQYRAQRLFVNYARVPAAIAAVSGNDPNELALLLLRVPSAEPEAAARLAALRECLSARGFEVELEETGLTVIAPVDHLGYRHTVEVVCEPRPDDAGRLWFWSQTRPLAEADRIIDAVLAIVALLRPSS